MAAADSPKHADPSASNGVAEQDPFGLGWTEETFALPPKVILNRMDVKRMHPLRFLHKACLPVQYQEPFYNSLYDSAREYSWLAQFTDVLVGDCCCRLEPMRPEGAAEDSPPKGWCLYVMTLCVLEPYRGRGIGSLLIKHVMRDSFENKKIDAIALHVQTTNERAQKFYQKLGFKNKRKVEKYYKDLEDRDAFLLQLDMPRKEE